MFSLHNNRHNNLNNMIGPLPKHHLLTTTDQTRGLEQGDPQMLFKTMNFGCRPESSLGKLSPQPPMIRAESVHSVNRNIYNF